MSPQVGLRGQWGFDGNILPGDVLVQHDTTIWTRVAKAVSGKPFPHAMLVQAPLRESLLALESNGTVRITRLGYDQVALGYEVWRPMVPPEVSERAIAHAEAQVGQAYGYLNLARLILKALLGLKPDAANRFIPGGPVCSQFVAEAFESAGWDPDPEVGSQDTRPWDFRDPRRFQPIYVRTHLSAGGGQD